MLFQLIFYLFYFSISKILKLVFIISKYEGFKSTEAFNLILGWQNIGYHVFFLNTLGEGTPG